MVLQGLVDRTLLLAPFPSDQRPNLLDPDSWGDQIRFVRDAEDVVTDGRPTFREWQRKVNEGVEHGHRIIGYFPTSFGREETPRTWPRNADGVNDEDVHTIYERQGELYFSFHRSDTIYRRSRWNADGGPARRRRWGRTWLNAMITVSFASTAQRSLIWSTTSEIGATGKNTRSWFRRCRRLSPSGRRN